jgi:hypothetical protein
MSSLPTVAVMMPSHWGCDKICHMDGCYSEMQSVFVLWEQEPAQSRLVTWRIYANSSDVRYVSVVSFRALQMQVLDGHTPGVHKFSKNLETITKC